MADASHCPHCGKKLPTTALPGLCPECMLKAGIPTDAPLGPGGTHVVRPLPQAAPVEEIAKYFPQLEILSCLGRGGMGVVYRARQPQLNRIVALKILAPEKEQDPSFGERFTREAQALARLNHPNIVTVFDFGRTNGLCYLLMEYVDGMSLRELLLAGKIMPEQALAIVPKICDALQFAHEQGVVHRDIKPENVLLDKHGRVKIADFGIAKIVRGEAPDLALTQDRQVVGTPHYMAPEQVEKPHMVDHRADIYSLGVVFYEMLTGELPLGKFAPPSRKVELDVRLDEVVLHALEKEPDRRYQHAREVKTDVESVTAERAHAAFHGTAKHGSRNYSYFALGFFCAGTLGTLVLLALSRRDELSLAFGALALVLAFLFGCISWRQRIGRGIAIATLIVFAAGAVTAGVLSEVLPVPFVNQRRIAAAEAARAAQTRDRELLARTLHEQRSVAVQPDVIPPVVIGTFPQSGASEIDPDAAELRVVFSEPMRDASWSWVSVAPKNAPEILGSPRFLADARTCILPVKLKPDSLYAVWINSTEAKNFTDISGNAAVPYLLIFQTRK